MIDCIFSRVELIENTVIHVDVQHTVGHIHLELRGDIPKPWSWKLFRGRILGPGAHQPLPHTHIEQETLMNKIKGDWERRAPQRAKSKAWRKCQRVSRVKCR